MREDSNDKREILEKMANIPKTWDLIKKNTELSEKVKTMKNTYVPYWKIISLESELSEVKRKYEEVNPQFAQAQKELQKKDNMINDYNSIVKK